MHSINDEAIEASSDSRDAPWFSFGLLAEDIFELDKSLRRPNDFISMQRLANGIRPPRHGLTLKTGLVTSFQPLAFPFALFHPSQTDRLGLEETSELGIVRSHVAGAFSHSLQWSLPHLTNG
jgi:hypothetical protein